MADSKHQIFPFIADELHWNDFVLELGGELVAPLIAREGVKNADYLFRKDAVIAELKILQTEFFDPLLIKIGQSAATLNQNPTDEAFELFERVMFSTLEAPLKRIVNKANRQIKETKSELGLNDHRGVMICINDSFVGFPPHIVSELLFGVLKGSSYTNTQCIIYLTNHYVKLAGSNQPSLLWWPGYNGQPSADLKAFVDNLGHEWSMFLSTRSNAPFKPLWDDTDSLRNARVVGKREGIE